MGAFIGSEDGTWQRNPNTQHTPQTKMTSRGQRGSGLEVIIVPITRTVSSLLGHQTVGGMVKKAMKTLAKETLKQGACAAQTTIRRQVRGVTRNVKLRVQQIKRRVQRIKRRIPGLYKNTFRGSVDLLTMPKMKRR